MTQHRLRVVTTAPRTHLPRRIVVVFVGLVASLGLAAAFIPGHHEVTAAARPETVSRPTTVSLPIKNPRSPLPSAEQVAGQVAEAVVLGVAPPWGEVTAALWKALQTRPAAKVNLAAGTASVSPVGIDGTEQLFEVTVTPLDAAPVPVDVVVTETNGRSRVVALPGIAS